MTQYLVLLVLLGLSAYFSASETAFSTVNKIRLKNYADNGSKKAKVALDIAENYDKTISTILVGNNVVNIASSSIATMLATAMLGATSGPVIATAVTTVLVLIFGEILPKSYGKQNSETFALATAKIMRWVTILLSPVSALFLMLQKAMARFYAKGDKSPSVTEEELKYIIETIEEEGVMEENEVELVQSALDFNDVTVQEILTHRVDVTAIDINDDTEDIVNLVMQESYTRIPVYEGSIDHIIGILQSRDLLEALVRRFEIDIRQMITEPIFVHKTKTAASMLAEFKRRKAHIAIVTDDYGGTMGIVTMEDLLEEIVGEIWDEDEEIEQEFLKLSDGSYEVSGDMDIEDLFEKFDYYNRNFNSEYSTVGGWALETLEHLPEVGETFAFDGFTIEVLEMDEQRITKLRVWFDPEKSSIGRAE